MYEKTERQEVTIVTGFFDIGRKDWGKFSRDNQKYVDYFRFWARMQNKVIIYTNPGMEESIREACREFNREDRTEIIVVEDVTQFDAEVFQAMEKALSHPLAVKFRLMPQNPECHSAYYDFIMFVKPFLVQDAIKRGLADGTIAWMDFGYNHGGEYYADPKEFDFLWTVQLAEDKVHLFTVSDLDDMPIFEIVRQMPVYITGGMVIASARLWPQLAALYHRSAMALAYCGFADDDQTLSIMSCRMAPELFELHPINPESWFQPLELTSEKIMTKVVPEKEKPHKLSKAQAKLACSKKQYFLGMKCFGKYVVQKMLGR